MKKIVCLMVVAVGLVLVTAASAKEVEPTNSYCQCTTTCSGNPPVCWTSCVGCR